MGAPARGARALDRHGEARRRDGVAVWYGGGGPPSYAWIRVGSDGRATVVTAMQDIGTGTKTAMAQIAAEELGIPLDHVTVTLGDSRAARSRRSRPARRRSPSMGPAVRAAAADAKRQIIEIAAQRYDLEERVLDIGAATSSPPTAICNAARGGGRPARERADPRQGRARPEPDRDDRAHLRRAGRRGRRRCRDRRSLGRPRRGDPRRRSRDQPARRREPGRGRDHPGDRPHAFRAPAARPADRRRSSRRASTRTSCRRSPTCRRSSAS